MVALGLRLSACYCRLCIAFGLDDAAFAVVHQGLSARIVSILLSRMDAFFACKINGRQMAPALARTHVALCSIPCSAHNSR